MRISKQQVIDSFYKIMCTSITNRQDFRVNDNAYFKRRVVGFEAEYEFENEIKRIDEELVFLAGGQILYPELSGEIDELNNFTYVTFDSRNHEEYKKLYKLISAWNQIDNLYYIEIEHNNWSLEIFSAKENNNEITTEILKPSFKFFIFNKESYEFEFDTDQSFNSILSIGVDSLRKPSKSNLRDRELFNYLDKFDLESLMNVYATRYFLDYKKRNKSKILIIDFDGFLITKNLTFIVEIKSKSPMNNDSENINEWKYGWDTRRIIWYQHIQEKLNLPVLYCIKQIDNRLDRNFIRWDSILLENFLKGVTWSFSTGGGGGEDTLIAPYSFFSELSDFLEL